MYYTRTECDNKLAIAPNCRKARMLFSKYCTGCIQILRPHQLPYGVVCMDRRITNTYGSSAQSQFIYTETQGAFFLPSVETLLTIYQNIIDLNTNGLHFAMSEVILPLPRNALCTPLFIYHKSTIMLSMYRNCMSHVAVTVNMCCK